MTYTRYPFLRNMVTFSCILWFLRVFTCVCVCWGGRSLELCMLEYVIKAFSMLFIWFDLICFQFRVKSKIQLWQNQSVMKMIVSNTSVIWTQTHAQQWFKQAGLRWLVWFDPTRFPTGVLCLSGGLYASWSGYQDIRYPKPEIFHTAWFNQCSNLFHTFRSTVLT